MRGERERQQRETAAERERERERGETERERQQLRERGETERDESLCQIPVLFFGRGGEDDAKTCLVDCFLRVLATNR